MFGKPSSQPPPFGTIHVDDDPDIEVRRPRDAARKHLWHESRLLIRDLIFALMLLVLVMVGVAADNGHARRSPLRRQKPRALCQNLPSR